jgi:hypothetical protein
MDKVPAADLAATADRSRFASTGLAECLWSGCDAAGVPVGMNFSAKIS